MTMYMILLTFIVSSSLLNFNDAYIQSDIISAKIETCRGCSLNRLPEIKKFVFEDAPLYDRLEIKFISGASPELVLLGEGDKELERLPLSHLNRKDCNSLLKSKGFLRTNNKEEF